MCHTTSFTPDWPPNWINASDNGIRSYSWPDSILFEESGVVRCAVGKSATRFISVFGSIFMVFFLVVGWLAIEDFEDRVAFMTLGLFFGTATFGLIYAIAIHHQEKGDYVIVDKPHRRIELPRHDRIFNMSDVQCLQLLTGRDRNSEDIDDSDLNLLVAEGNDIVRYHLIGNPNRDHAQAIARAMQTLLVEQHVPAGWYRSSDRKTHATDRSNQGSIS